jgi:hypothetical protein
MGQTINYYQADALELNEIIELEQYARRRLPGFGGFEPGTELDLFCKRQQLPQLDHFSGLDIGRITIAGTLARSSDPHAQLAVLLAKGETIRALGSFTVYLEFTVNPAAGPVRQRLYLQGRADQVNFGCDLSGRAVVADPKVCVGQIQALIDQTRLPLTIHWRDQQYFLQASANDVVWISRGGSHRENPSGFRYRLDAASLSEALGYLQRVIAAQADKTRYRLDWSVGSVAESGSVLMAKPQHSAALYTAVVNAGLAAQNHELQLLVQLNDLAGLAALQALCDSRDRIFTPLGSYRPDNYNCINFDIVTTQDGHRIQVESKVPVAIDELNRLLGLRLREIPARL